MDKEITFNIGSIGSKASVLPGTETYLQSSELMEFSDIFNIPEASSQEAKERVDDFEKMVSSLKFKTEEHDESLEYNFEQKWIIFEGECKDLLEGLKKIVEQGYALNEEDISRVVESYVVAETYITEVGKKYKDKIIGANLEYKKIGKERLKEHTEKYKQEIYNLCLSGLNRLIGIGIVPKENRALFYSKGWDVNTNPLAIFDGEPVEDIMFYSGGKDQISKSTPGDNKDCFTMFSNDFIKWIDPASLDGKFVLMPETGNELEISKESFDEDDQGDVAIPTEEELQEMQDITREENKIGFPLDCQVSIIQALKNTDSIQFPYPEGERLYTEEEWNDIFLDPKIQSAFKGKIKRFLELEKWEPSGSDYYPSAHRDHGWCQTLIDVNK